jgi:predicted kinase
MKPHLFVTVGSPGSGKTYFSSKFAKEFNYVHLNSDFLRLTIIEKPNYTKEEHAVVFNAMDLMAEMFLKRKISVIYDANATRVEYRKRLMQIAKRTRSNYYILFFETPIENALKRISNRHIKHINNPKMYRKIKPSVLHKIRNEIEISPKEKIIKIDGLKPYRIQKLSLKHLHL